MRLVIYEGSVRRAIGLVGLSDRARLAWLLIEEVIRKGRPESAEVLLALESVGVDLGEIDEGRLGEAVYKLLKG